MDKIEYKIPEGYKARIEDNKVILEPKESEDERMKEMAIKAVYAPEAQSCIKSWGINPDDVIAWLEKQGEQKSDDKVKAKQNSDLEKGKWYVCDTPRYKDFIVGKAYYCPKNEMLKSYEDDLPRYVAKHCFHPWTIQDAKDGDILASSSSIFIFQKEYMAGKPTAYCGIMNDGVLISGQGGCWTNEQCYPATPGQCDLLFQKLKEAGYEWDAEKKELKKIEQDPAWSEEDEKMLRGCISATFDNRSLKECEWLLSLKERYTWKPSDEQIKALEDSIEFLGCTKKVREDLKSLYEQLKKLRE